MPLRTLPKNDYPTTDGRPMAETELHRDLAIDLIRALQHWFADVPEVVISGNLLIHYEPGNRRRHVAPDVFVRFGATKGERDNYLLWEEGSPNFVLELTSRTTRREDVETKMELYRDTLQVREYFLFDPREEYLTPSLQGYRLVNGEYRPIRMMHGRLRSQQLGVFLERDGRRLRLIDVATGEQLRTPEERAAESEERAEESAARAAAEAAARRQAEAQQQRTAAELDQMRAALEQSQRELEELRRQRGK